MERHTWHTIASWSNANQWVIVHISDLRMIMRQSIYILSIITKEMGKLNTAQHIVYWITEHELNLTHTLDKIYLTGIQ